MTTANAPVTSHPAVNESLPTIGLFRAVLSNFQDGFILADATGHIFQINRPAQHICAFLTDRTEHLPAEIWHPCQSAAKQIGQSSTESPCLDADLILPKIGTIRIRVQMVTIHQSRCFIILLEDRQRSLRNRALSDAAIYGLTEREAEVWALKLRGKEYSEISETLWISQNTVKKHVKNIRSKQRSYQDDLEFAMMA